MIADVLALYLGYLFFNSAVDKLVEPRTTLRRLERVVPALGALALFGVVTLGVAEAGVSFLVLWDRTREVGLVLLVAVLLGYSLVLAARASFGRATADCGCGAQATPGDSAALVRNVALQAAACIALLDDAVIHSPNIPRSAYLIAVGLVVLGVVVLPLCYYRVRALVAQHPNPCPVHGIHSLKGA
jgi:hypothetical protein